MSSFWVMAIILLGLSSCGDKPKEPVGPAKITHTAVGKDLNITTWQAELPADVIVVIDQSGSMSKGKTPTDPHNLRLKGSRSFMEFLAGRSPHEKPNRFGVVNFGSEAPRQQAVPLTPIQSQDDDTIRQISAKLVPLDLGDTSFIKALYLSMEFFEEGGSFKESRNRAIVIFTDGEPDDSRRKKMNADAYFSEISQFVTQKIQPRGIELFIVGIDAAGKKWSASIPYWQKIVGTDHVLSTPTMELLKNQFNYIVQRIWHLPEVKSVVVSSQSPMEFDIEPYLAAVEFHFFPGKKGLTLRITRPDKSVVKPGEDPHVPPVKRFSTFERLVVYEPEPGRWSYEVVGGEGSVEVLRNPIPLKMRLISPARIHPQGKPMPIIAEFKRSDGKLVKSHPDYPLGLSASVRLPDGNSIPVKFSLEKGMDGVFTGESMVTDAQVIGQYQITLKVSGGGRYHNQQTTQIQVQPIPYIKVLEPSEGSTISPAASIKVRAQLLKAGQPVLPQSVFSNHPDQLIYAQFIRRADKKKGTATWLVLLKEAQQLSQFEAMVPLPDPSEGEYSLVLTIAPEEESKKELADKTIINLAIGNLPWPMWKHLALWLGIAAPLLALLGWGIVRRRRLRLRLPLYYWVEGRSIGQVLTFMKANEIKQLAEAPLKITRIGKEKAVKFEPAEGALLLTGDGTRIPALEAREGGRLIVHLEAGGCKAIHFDFQNYPPPPQPCEQITPPKSGGVPSAEGETSATGDKFKWNFGSSVD